MKKSLKNRRDFIIDTGKATLALGLSSSLISALACSPNNKIIKTSELRFTQNNLLYNFDALQVAIDAQTMEIHYTKHATAYCKNLNEAYSAEIKNLDKSIIEIFNEISKYSDKMRNNGGGHFNHEMFWQCLTPNFSDLTSGKLFNKIVSDFGSLESFKTQFTSAAKNRFGSGWAWLIKTKDGKLVIGSTPNQDNPLMYISDLKGTPLLCLDVWEHAYYLRYQNKRADYVDNFWKIVNWSFVEKNYSES